MRLLGCVVAILVSTPALAGGPRPYVGAGLAGTAGGGLEGLSVMAVGSDVVTGLRLSRWWSLEGFFEMRYATGVYVEPTEGAECSGEYTHLWHWETYGLRAWVHLVHSSDLDVSIAPPSIGVGPLYDHGRSLQSPSAGFCYQPPVDSHGTLLVVGLFGIAFEYHPDKWFGIRFSADVTLDVPTTFYGPAALAVSGAAGPVIHF